MADARTCMSLASAISFLKEYGQPSLWLSLSLALLCYTAVVIGLFSTEVSEYMLRPSVG